MLGFSSELYVFREEKLVLPIDDLAVGIVSILRAEGWAGVVHSGQLSPLGFTRSGDLLADKTFEHDGS